MSGAGILLEPKTTQNPAATATQIVDAAQKKPPGCTL